MVQCRLGTEREMVISLLQKYNDMAAAGTPLGIKSAFCHDHLSVRAVDGALVTDEKLLGQAWLRDSSFELLVDKAALAQAAGEWLQKTNQFRSM